MTRWLFAAVLMAVGLCVQLNYTYYYEYEFPHPDCLHVTLLSYQKGRNLTELVEKVRESWRVVGQVAGRYNGTLVGESDEAAVGIDWETDYELQKSITIEVKQQQVGDLLDQMQAMSSQYGFYIDIVEEALSAKQDLEQHAARARQQAELKSQEICKKYFNMELKSIALFEEYVEQQEKEDHQEDQEQIEEKIHQNSEKNQATFVGNLQQVIELKMEQQAESKTILENTIYKCQIICEGEANLPKKPKPAKVPKKQSERKSRKLSTLKDRINSQL